ncbi:hypothetical protein OK016_30250 [Vibrio chagasii]|nr:hypothetical protein [Vibrio chagasii]
MRLQRWGAVLLRCRFCCGVAANPFFTGIAHTIAELPLYQACGNALLSVCLCC